MKLHTHLPVHSPLREYVTEMWEVLSQRDVLEVIMPQGIVEIVFNFSGTVHGVLPHSCTSMQAPRCFIQGINTQVVEARYVGQQHLFGVRLYPHMVHSLLGIMPAETKNATIDLALIKPAFNTLWHQFIEAASFSSFFRALPPNSTGRAKATTPFTCLLRPLFHHGLYVLPPGCPQEVHRSPNRTP